MANSLIIDNKSYGARIALLENSKLIELHNESSDNAYVVGDIYLGTVRKFSTGLNAAFVDIGYGKDAFLHYHDLGPQILSTKKFVQGVLKGSIKSSNISHIPNETSTDKDGLITDILKSGDKILVQVSKEPISTKGPRITAEITMAGRFLVLVPFSDRVSVSSRIKEKEERDRLIKLLKSIKPKNFGIIVRTVAETMTTTEVEKDLKDLMDSWNKIFGNMKQNLYAQKILGEINTTHAFLRDMLNPSFSEIAVNDIEIMNEIKSYVKNIAPDKENIVKLYKGQMPIFDEYGIEKQIKTSFGKFVVLKSGAYLVIEHTEALHVIDVNSGVTSRKDTTQENNALKVNLEAAEEIARQFRLRDMGGIIVVDFIDMKSDENRKVLHEKMKEFLATDKAKHSILPLSRFGLMEITRERIKPVMNIDTTEECPSCGGAGKIEPSIITVDRIFADLQKVMNNHLDKKVTLVVHPFMESNLIARFPSVKMKWMWTLKKMISIKSSAANELLEYYFIDQKGNTLD